MAAEVLAHAGRAGVTARSTAARAGRPAPSLRGRLSWLVAVALLPFALLAVGLSYAGYLAERERAGQRTVELARGMALAVERELRAMTASLEALALSPSLAAGDLAAFRREAETLVARHFAGANILLVAPDGRQLLNLYRPPGAPLAQRGNLEGTRRVLETGLPQVSDVYEGAVTRAPVMALDVPVRGAAGEVTHVLSLGPPLAAFAEIIQRQQPRPGWVTAILDRRGTVVARVPDPEGRFAGRPASPSFLSQLLARDEGVAESTTLDGIPVLSGFSRPGPSGWSVAIGVPRAELYAPLWRSLALTAGATLLALLGALAAARALAARIARPVRALVDLAGDGGRAGAAPPPSLGLREVDEVAAALAAAQAARAEGEERFRLAAEAVQGAIYDHDLRTGRFVRLGAYRELFGYGPDEIPATRQGWRDRVHPEDAGALGAALAAVYEGTAGRIDVEYRARHRDGRWVHCWQRALAVRDGAGRLLRVVGSVVDVSARRAAEAALARAAEEFRTLADNISQLAWMTEPDGWITWYNRRWFDYTGTTLEEMRGWGWRAVHHPDHVERVTAGFRAAVEAGEPWEDTFPLRGAGGAYRWFLSRALPIRGEDGRVLRWFGTNTDVTGQREAEAALREGEARLRLATEAAEVGFWDVDVVNDVLVWPPIVKAMFGISAEAPASMADFFAGLHPEDREATAAAYAAACDPAVRALYDVEYRTVGKEDGVVRWVAAKGRGVFDDAGRCVRVLGTAIDATARKAADAARRAGEEALRRSEAQFRTTAEALPGMLFVTTAAGSNIYVNAGFCAYTGRRPEDLLGDRWTEVLHPDDAARGWAIWSEAVRTGAPYEAEYRFLRRDGAWRWHAVRALPSRGADGAVDRWVGTCVDIHDRREAEDALRRLNEGLEACVRAEVAAREAAQAGLAHAQRMEALGQLAGGIAHDFNNVLQAVQGGARLIEGAPADAGRVRRLAAMIAEAAGRGAAVTRRLLAFSRRADLRAEPVDAAALLGGLREILAHTLGAGVEVRVQAPAAGLPPLLADKGQLETVLVNLAANARDAMAGAGVVTLSAAAEAPGAAGRPAALRPGGAYVRLSVADTGAGMDAATLARAAEPFFTTKPPGKGTGLGLAMARGFAEQSGGALAIESAPGRGTTVRLWFPVAEGAQAPRPGAPAEDPAAPAPAAADGRARVLLADDEVLVRAITAEGLEAAGYAVLAVGKGAEALELLDAGEAVDLLVTDLSMPGMDGLALIREAQRRRPGLPAILLTGFATDAAELALGGALSGSFSLLRKPVEARALAERAAVLLEAAAERGAARAG